MTKYVSLLLIALSLTACTQTEQALVMPDLLARRGDSTSGEYRKAQAAVAELRSKIKNHPEVAKQYSDLAGVYIQESRVSGFDHFYFPVANRLLDEALKKDAKYFDVFVLRASMQMTQHRFADAKETITKGLAINPNSSAAYGILADANTELGLYDQAVASIDKMMNARPDLRAYSRASYQREIRGDLDGAISAMKLAADAGAFGQENRCWTLYQLANLFLHEGKLDTAAYIYNGILQERPNFGFALSGLAMVAVAKHDYPTAISNLQKAIAALDSHSFMEQLADVYLASGDRTNAKLWEQKVLREFADHKKEGANIAREYAAFCADHNIELSDALASAEADYKSRPENIDACDTYAWTLYKNNRATEAKPIMEKALRMKSLNPTLYIHASMIAEATGDMAMATNYRLSVKYLPPVFEKVLLAKQ